MGGVISSRQLLPSPKYFRKIKSNPCPLCGAWKLTLCVHMTLTKKMKTGLPPTEGRTQEAEALPAPSAAQCPLCLPSQIKLSRLRAQYPGQVSSRCPQYSGARMLSGATPGSRAAVIKCLQLGGFKQQTFLLSQFWRPEV